MTSLREKVGRTIFELRAEELRRKRAARQAEAGINLASAVADVHIVPDWLDELRQVSPRTNLYSFLMPYWYRAKARWVLYDVQPIETIDDDLPVGIPGVSGRELKEWMAGPRPSEREDWKDLDSHPVSDTQHEMWRLWGGYARPFWVLQGDNGGHQYRFSPDQGEALVKMGLPSEPPKIGDLAPCPFDNRVRAQLQHLNRLHQLEDSIGRLRASAGVEYVMAQRAAVDRDIREAELAFIERQMRAPTEMAMTLSQHSEHDDELRHRTGQASAFSDALDQYIETGDYPI